MNEKNLEYLKKSLDNLGFGTRLNDVLESAIHREIPKFTLGINNHYLPPESRYNAKAAPDQIRFELNFNKGKESDMYFMNDYKVSLQKSGEAQPRVRTFDLERDHRITALQAYKLLSGFSLEKDVYPRQKEGEERGTERPEKTRVWLKLSLDITDAYGQHPLRSFYPEYQYNLADSLDKYPLKGLDDPGAKASLLKGLQNGNLLDAELTIGKKELPVLIAANPQMKTIDIYDRKTMAGIRDEQIWPEKAAAKSVTAPAAGTQRQPLAETGSYAADAGQEQPWQQDPNQEAGRSRGR